MIQFIKPVVRIVGTGWVGSIDAHLFGSGEREQIRAAQYPFLDSSALRRFWRRRNRYSNPRHRDFKDSERINGVIADRTGQSVERVTEDTSRRCWMSAEESVEYGLIGKIISSIDEIS